MPDLNSVPASPRPLANRRQSSKDMPPPAVPSDPSLNILPSNQSAVSSSTPAADSQVLNSQPQTPASHTRDASTEAGPGPLRHPRPLTASELHIELEKEQEAVVNRLTRELSLLRAAQNASVVSNTSSTSATPSNQEPPNEPLLSGSGFSIPGTNSRHRRTSSATSQQLGSSFDARRSLQAVAMSRQGSTASRRSRGASPAPSNALDPSTYFQQQRMPPPSSAPQTMGGDQLSPGMMPGTARFEETQHFKNELEAAKKENELLKRKIRDLEKAVRERRHSQESRPRSESASTTASMSVAPSGTSIAGPRDSIASRTGRDRGSTTQSTASTTGPVGVSEEEVQVGESAAGRPAEQHAA